MEARQLFPEMHDYATYKNAERNVLKAIEALTDEGFINYVVAAKPNGRFYSFVILSGENKMLMHYFINKKVGVKM